MSSHDLASVAGLHRKALEAGAAHAAHWIDPFRPTSTAEMTIAPPYRSRANRSFPAAGQHALSASADRTGSNSLSPTVRHSSSSTQQRLGSTRGGRGKWPWYLQRVSRNCGKRPVLPRFARGWPSRGQRVQRRAESVTVSSGFSQPCQRLLAFREDGQRTRRRRQHLVHPAHTQC